MANHFLVFIGGTGAKCAEAFAHMAAAGAVGGPDQVFHLLTLDVDATNGNRALALEAIHRYQLLREQFPATGQFMGSSLFGPRLVHYDWQLRLPDSFSHAAGVNCLHALRTQNSPDEEALMRLFYSDEELGFDFSREGFHAIPAIGAPILRHILDEGVDLGGLKDFVDVLRAEISAHSRLIVVGSIFGGTGACGIPAILNYLTAKARGIALAGTLHTHGVLLLPYYHFAEPGEEAPLGVHARRFYNNARGALAFYRDMERELGYESLYLLGSPIDYNMGPYRPGMEGQRNPPTPVEWESALAIAHCIAQPATVSDEPVQYLHGVPGLSTGEAAQALRMDWASLSLPVRDALGNTTRFIAAFLGYYLPYIRQNFRRETGMKPFLSELVKPYLDHMEAEHMAFATLEAFCTRYWDWLRASLQYDILRQGLFSDRMMLSAAPPYRHLSTLVQNAAAPRWVTVEDAVFDGIRPQPMDEPGAHQRNAGLFVHGLYAHCAPQ